MVFAGREDELAELTKLEFTNIELFRQCVATKQMYNCPLVHGPMGIGKSRLLNEFNRGLAARHGSSCNTAFITIDPSIGDNILPTLDADQFIGLHVFCRFFFGTTPHEMKPLMASRKIPYEIFGWHSVLPVISSKYASKSTLLLAIHLDEFTFISSIVGTVVKIFAGHMTQNHSLNVCLLPSLSGTTTTEGLAAIKWSQINPYSMLLGPLSTLETRQIITWTTNNRGINIPSGRYATAVEASLGDNPRNVELFLEFFSVNNKGMRINMGCR